MIAVITLLQLGYTQLLARSEKVETLMEGKPVELVRDGVLQVRAMAGVPMNPRKPSRRCVCATSNSSVRCAAPTSSRAGRSACCAGGPRKPRPACR